MHRILWLLVVLAAASARAQSPADFDGDGRLNGADNCRYTANASQFHSSLPPDGVGDACTCGDADEFTSSVGTLPFGPDDINGSDCFHPSLLGQNAIAERLWRNSPVR